MPTLVVGLTNRSGKGHANVHDQVCLSDTWAVHTDKLAQPRHAPRTNLHLG